ncbi:Cro/Cl family transcriptional regulator [Enterobacterales bacterium CwR94]|nr:Cro/Cl family transcriptional regulator [Enterobacterales bacterium CwR94]
MDELKQYLNALSAAEKIAFEASCGTTINYLRKAMSKGQILGPELCVLIEKSSNGAITRQDLNPERWRKIWPELEVSANEKPVNYGANA